MLNQFIPFPLTLFVLVGLNYLITIFTKVKFIDYAFIVGLLVAFIIWFFSHKKFHPFRVLAVRFSSILPFKNGLHSWDGN
ncbi:hypothetical protein ACF5W4_14235 [Bacillota bacterium Lsc_1132]